MSLSLTIPWKPHAKERPRFNSKTRKAYTPKSQVLAEREIREEFLARQPDGFKPFDEPIEVKLFLDHHAFRIVVEPRRIDEPTLKGDIDNYAKTILDALNGIAWADDDQIDELWVTK